jgi:hypothetical protein
VAIVSPPNGAVFCAPLDLRLVAAAGDSDGWVTTVEFFDGTNSLGKVRNPIVILDATPVRLPDLNTDVLTANSLTRPVLIGLVECASGQTRSHRRRDDNAGDSTRSRPIEIAVAEHQDLPVVALWLRTPSRAKAQQILRRSASDGQARPTRR